MARLEIYIVRGFHPSQSKHAWSEYRLSGGCRRKHWIETLISKLIFDAFNFT